MVARFSLKRFQWRLSLAKTLELYESVGFDIADSAQYYRAQL